MLKIVIALIAIALVIALIKNILFNPKVNSFLSIAAISYGCYILYSGMGLTNESIFIFILAFLAIIDCVKDIVKAECYYEDIDLELDRFYVFKSIFTILTLGVARVLYLIIICPAIIFFIKVHINIMISENLPFDPISKYKYKAQIKYYYCERITNNYERNGIIVSNKDTVKREIAISNKKMNEQYPEKFLKSVFDRVKKVINTIKAATADDSNLEAIAKKQKIEDELREIEKATENRKKYKSEISNASGKIYYLSNFAYNALRNNVHDILLESSRLSPRTLIEKKMPTVSNKYLELGMDFFLIQVLIPDVKSGLIEDEDVSDEPMVNHAYKHTQSKVQVKVINANEDPRLALD